MRRSGLEHPPLYRRGPAGFHACLALLFLLLGGCLALDYTPLEERPFYAGARKTIEAIKPPATASGQLLAGSAKVEITPPKGTPLAGFGGRSSVGVHDPVFARALVLSNGVTTVALVSADLLAVTDDITQAVREKVGEEVPWPAENLMIAATNTHSGPGGLAYRLWEKVAAGPFDPEYFAQVTGKMARIVGEANRSLKPSRVATLTSDATDLTANRIIRWGPKDPEVRALVFESLDGSRSAYVVNFSAHPTVLGSDNRLVSGDFPGFLCRALEGREGTVALYTAGAVADQRPTPPPGPDRFERARAMGDLLARRLLEAPDSALPRGCVSLASTRLSVPLPPPQPKVSATRRLPTWIGRLFFDGRTEIQILRIGRTLLLGVPADLGSEIGLAWKGAARSAGNDALVIGFANGYIGYIMPSSYYDKPIYEARMAFNGPYMADYLERLVRPFLLAGYGPGWCE